MQAKTPDAHRAQSLCTQASGISKPFILTLRPGVCKSGVRVFVLEADTSEGETPNKCQRVAFIYLFIYQAVCVWQGVLGFWVEGNSLWGVSSQDDDKISLSVSATWGHLPLGGDKRDPEPHPLQF